MNNFSFDKIIFGNDLDSLALSYLTGIPVVCENLNYPLFFEHFESSQDLEVINFSNEKKSIKTVDQVIELNDAKLNVYKKIIFVLSILGKIRFSNNIKFISLENQNRLKVCTETNKIYYVDFNNLYIVNDNLLKNCDYKSIEPLKYKVIERFHVAKKLAFGIDLFENQTDFMKNIHMVYSSTISCVIESYMNKEDFEKLEHSFLYQKYNLIRLFEKYGENLSKIREPFIPKERNIYERNKIVYNETDSIKQIQFSLDDYLCPKRRNNSITLELQDAYQLIVAHKFFSMCTQTF